MQTIEAPDFFTSAEHTKLSQLQIKHDGSSDADRCALAALMLSPLLELAVADGATTTGEFAVIEQNVQRIESEFELTTKEDLESVATAMGLLPFVKAEWTTADFESARALLQSAILRLPEKAQHAVRDFIARGALEVANASGGILHLLNISRNERSILHCIIEELELDRCAEGLYLIGKTGDRRMTALRDGTGQDRP
jgi:hypothetical protein